MSVVVGVAVVVVVVIFFKNNNNHVLRHMQMRQMLHVTHVKVLTIETVCFHEF